MKYDLTVIGGGIIGLTVSLLAAQKGKKVLLVDSHSKLASETSANSHRIMHGGFRYLSNLDLFRARESAIELNWMFENFSSEVVRPMKCCLPLKTLGLQSKYPVSIACNIFNLLTLGLDKIVGSEVKSTAKLDSQSLAYLNSGSKHFLTWTDGLLLDHYSLIDEIEQKLTLAGGYVIKNAKIEKIYRNREEYRAIITVKDGSVPETRSVMTKAIITCAGIGVNSILLDDKTPEISGVSWARAFNLRLKRDIKTNFAYGKNSEHGNAIFIVPRMIKRENKVCAIGTCYLPCDYTDRTNQYSNLSKISDTEVENFLKSVNNLFSWKNEGYENISFKDIVKVESGLIPVKSIEVVADTENTVYKPNFFGKSFLIERDNNFIDLINTKYSSFRATAKLALRALNNFD